MKQIWVYSFLVILIFSCQSKEKAVEEENVYPRKKWFSVTENDKRLDSVRIAFAKEGVEEIKISYVGTPSDFPTGKFHFLILNEKDAFMISRVKTYIDGMVCGTDSEKDYTFEKEKIESYLDSIQPIKLSEIQNYLLQNKDKIIAGKEFRQSPAVVSFALKNDTLKGSFMHDILNFMESNGMRVYLIRRMNDKELAAVESYLD